MNEKVLVTGASGFLGRHIVPVLENKHADVISLSSKDFDLTREDQIVSMFEKHKPAIVVHLAAYVGGILANKNYPADFFYRNIVMTTMVPHYAYKYGVKKFLTLMGGCSYPAFAKSPIGEDQMWDGYPQPESAPYSIAKKVALVQAEAYQRQYGFNFVVLIPGNVYGEFDNFNLENSHVIPAMIRKIYEAKKNNIPQIAFWGTGNPVRDFVYVDDVAQLIPYFLEQYTSNEPVNLSSGISTSISELAELIRDIIGYSGEIIWDDTKPDGQMIKIFDPKKLNNMGMHCDTPLKEGLQKTIKWFIENYNSGVVRL